MTIHALHNTLASADEPMPPAQPDDWRICNPTDEIAPPFTKVGVTLNARIHADSSLDFYATTEVFTDYPELTAIVASFLAAYFQISVTPCTDISLSNIASHNQRGNQFRTAAFLDPLGARSKPSDKRLVITSRDIYHDDSDRFVFGVADHYNSKAVVSLHCYEIPACTALAGISLVRLLKVTSHELGHLYSLRHCTAALCNMNGKNSVPELDRHPVELCSQCLATFLWFTGVDPQKRFSDLHRFYSQYNLRDEQKSLSTRIVLLNESGKA